MLTLKDFNKIKPPLNYFKRGLFFMYNQNLYHFDFSLHPKQNK